LDFDRLPTSGFQLKQVDRYLQLAVFFQGALYGGSRSTFGEELDRTGSVISSIIIAGFKMANLETFLESASEQPGLGIPIFNAIPVHIGIGYRERDIQRASLVIAGYEDGCTLPDAGGGIIRR
jgi:hypothetical protein